MVISGKNPLILGNHTSSSQSAPVPSNRYMITGHLGDGTFGRALKCIELPSELKDSKPNNDKISSE